eukprot:Hpha_TRINITY_DN16515_c1_g6::TRINITY_DN16515_c1_g6_i1::g.133842::m.133842
MLGMEFSSSVSSAMADQLLEMEAAPIAKGVRQVQVLDVLNEENDAEVEESPREHQRRSTRGGLPPGDNVVYVGGLPSHATQRDVRELFQESFGPVRRTRLLYDNRTQRRRGYGFVKFVSQESADLAVQSGKVFWEGVPLEIGRSVLGVSTQRQPTAQQGRQTHTAGRQKALVAGKPAVSSPKREPRTEPQVAVPQQTLQVAAAGAAGQPQGMQLSVVPQHSLRQAGQSGMIVVNQPVVLPMAAWPQPMVQVTVPGGIPQMVAVQGVPFQQMMLQQQLLQQQQTVQMMAPQMAAPCLIGPGVTAPWGNNPSEA